MSCVPDPPDADRGGTVRVLPDVVDEHACLWREGELTQCVPIDLRLRLEGADFEREGDGVEERKHGDATDVALEVPLVRVGEQSQSVPPLEGTDQSMGGLEGSEDVGESFRELLGGYAGAGPSGNLAVEPLRGDVAAFVPGVEA